MKSVFASIAIYALIYTSTSVASDLYSTKEIESLEKRLATNNLLMSLDKESRDEFAHNLLESGFSYETIEPRITGFLKKGDLPFKALKKAILAEQRHQWRTNQLNRLAQTPDLTTSQIQNLKLKASEQQVAFLVYALCIEPLKDKSIREERIPKICAPEKGYDHMRHYSDSVSLRTKPSNKNNARVKAYELLVAAGKEVIKSEKLNNLEILTMSKCVAETSLKFKVPTKHPFTACHESIKASMRSPESALFQEKGVCPNTSGVAYNMARALGFSGPLFLARHHLHVFLETQVDNKWLHFHPLNGNNNSCDFISFDT